MNIILRQALIDFKILDTLYLCLATAFSLEIVPVGENHLPACQIESEGTAVGALAAPAAYVVQYSSQSSPANLAAAAATT